MMKKSLAMAFLLLLNFSCIQEKGNLSKITAKTTLIDSTTVQDSSVVKLFLPYKKKMIDEINTVISYTPKNLVRTDGNLQSSLGNFLADVCFDKGNELFNKLANKQADFALFNYGGIRAGVTKGPVKFEHAFKLMPFENTLVVVELSYDKMQELIKYFVEKNSAHPLSKQIQLTIKNKKATVLINGKSLSKDKTYFVITSNYLQNGGDHMNFFKDPISLTETDYLMRQAIVDGFKKQDTVQANLDNRVIVK